MDILIFLRCMDEHEDGMSLFRFLCLRRNGQKTSGIVDRTRIEGRKKTVK